MNKEKYNQIIDEAYERYWSSIEISEYDGIGPTSIKLPILTKEEFINKCKTDSEFSEKWGLKIEERELSGEERWGLLRKKVGDDIFKNWVDDIMPFGSGLSEELRVYNIPTKLITLTYNNETIESYE